VAIALRQAQGNGTIASWRALIRGDALCAVLRQAQHDR
jgi:hypothetical protein